MGFCINPLCQLCSNVASCTSSNNTRLGDGFCASAFRSTFTGEAGVGVGVKTVVLSCLELAAFLELGAFPPEDDIVCVAPAPALPTDPILQSTNCFITSAEHFRLALKNHCVSCLSPNPVALHKVFLSSNEGKSNFTTIPIFLAT